MNISRQQNTHAVKNENAVIATQVNKKYNIPNSQISSAQASSASSSLSTDPSLNLSTAQAPKKNSFLEGLSQNKLKEAMAEYVNTSKNGQVHEEQLQYILVNAILSAKSKKLGDEYSKSFASLSAHSRSTEDNVKSALQDVVSKNLITKDDAEAIHGLTFRAAQLDGNLEALYDGIGGPNDPTKATAEVQVALEKANAMIQSIRQGKEDYQVRSLDAPSNVIQRSSAQSSSDNISSVISTSSSSALSGQVSAPQGRGGNGFLWKPQSDNNGRLVVLMPPQLAGQVVSTEVHSSLPPSESTLVEKGSYSGNGNGGRDHFRFSKPGSTYSDGVFVIARLRSGEFVSYEIPETSARTTK